MSIYKSARTKNNSGLELSFSVLLAVLVAAVSMTGIYSENFYINETPNWQIQSIGQDIIDLVLVVPVLLVTTLMMIKNRKIGFPIWGGVILYLTYTFTIYSFDIHFNKLFVFYCLILGIAFYASIYFSYSQLRHGVNLSIESSLAKQVVGFYFIVIAIQFYFLWLSEIIPAIMSNQVPKTLTDAGLPTNPVHVLDLAVVLPGIFITGIQLLRSKKIGIVFTPVILTFFILMSITIAALSGMMLQKGLEGSLALTIGMSTLALFSLGLLIWFMKGTS